MEKRFYSKPEVSKTKIDCEVIMAGQSDAVSDPTVPDCPDGEECFINPFKWFR